MRLCIKKGRMGTVEHTPTIPALSLDPTILSPHHTMYHMASILRLISSLWLIYVFGFHASPLFVQLRMLLSINSFDSV